MSVTIHAQDVSRWFGEVVALNKFSARIGPGVTGMLGPNGAGKSTFFKLCTSQLRPSQGELSLFGEPIWSNYDVLRRIGFCPDGENYYEEMTGYEFVVALARCTGMHSADAIRSSLKAIERAGMTDRMHDRIASYSKGMRQRVKLAQCMAHDPEVLFLDEPMTGLDPVARHDTFQLIRELGDEGKTVVVSSHILYEIENVTSNVILLNNGCVLAEGDIRHIRDLIDQHPHSVSIECDRPRELASRLLDHPHIVSMEFDESGGGLHVFTRDPNAFYDRLPELVLEDEFQIDRITSPDDNLQAVFEYLVK